MTAPRWHPLLTAVETSTGTWEMLDAFDRAYGTIEIRRVAGGGTVRYRCTFRGEVIGWASTLRTGCERMHQALMAAQGPIPFAGYPDLSGSARRRD